MPTVRIDETLDLHYELDDYTDPWTKPETILLIHGVADTSKAWFAWIPRLARRFRLLRPDRVKCLTVIGGPATLAKSSLNPDAWLAQVQKDGVEAWARSTMDRRLGNVSPAMKEWWITEMGKSSAQVMAGIFRYVESMDITALLPRIQAPTLVITSDRSALASVETVRDWQTHIPNSQLLVLPSPAYHLAAAMPEECAGATLRFIAGLAA